MFLLHWLEQPWQGDIMFVATGIVYLSLLEQQYWLSYVYGSKVSTITASSSQPCTDKSWYWLSAINHWYCWYCYHASCKAQEIPTSQQCHKLSRKSKIEYIKVWSRYGFSWLNFYNFASYNHIPNPFVHIEGLGTTQYTLQIFNQWLELHNPQLW